MITIESILTNTIVFVCGTLSNENNLTKASQILKQNKFIYEKCKHVIFILNRKSDISIKEFEDYLLFIKSELSNSIILVDHINRNYQIGFIDQDLFAFNYVRLNNISYDYILKQTLDIVLYEEFLKLTFTPSDLIFIPELTCLDKNVSDLNLRPLFMDKSYDKNIGDEEFIGSWPQPWLFIISKNVTKMYSCDEDFLRELHAKWILDVKGDITKWHDQNKFLCSEEYLVKGLCGKNLTKYCLMSTNDFNTYCNFITEYRVGDATIKNVYLKNYGICHWHSKNHEVSILEF